MNSVVGMVYPCLLLKYVSVLSVSEQGTLQYFSYIPCTYFLNSLCDVCLSYIEKKYVSVYVFSVVSICV